MNIEEYRQLWESDEHWIFRREFLAVHKGKFSDDRLLCLAQIFANIELLGCTYPAPVMRQVNQLASAIANLDDLRKKRLEKATIKFFTEENNSGFKRKLDSNSGKKLLKISRTELDTSSDQHADFDFTSDDIVIPDYFLSQKIINTDHNFQILPPQKTAEVLTSKAGSSIVQLTGNSNISDSVQNISSTKNIPQSSPMEEKFKTIIDIIKSKFDSFLNPIKLLDYACERTSSKLLWTNHNLGKKAKNPLGQMASILTIDKVRVAEVVALTRKKSIIEAYRVALALLINPGFHLRKVGKKYQAEIAHTPEHGNAVNFNVAEDVNVNNDEDTEEDVNPKTDKSFIRNISQLASVTQNRFVDMCKDVKMSEIGELNVLQLLNVTSGRALLRVGYTTDLLEDFQNTWFCRVFLGGVLVSSGTGITGKIARMNAASNALSRVKHSSIKVLSKPYGVLEMDRSNDPVGEYEGAFSFLATIVHQRLFNLAAAIRKQEIKTPDEIELVRITASRANIKLYYLAEQLSDPTNFLEKPSFLSRLFLDGVLLGIGTGENLKVCKRSAYVKGLSVLKQYDGTFKIKCNLNGVFELEF